MQHFHGNFTLPGLVAHIKSRHKYPIELEKIAAAKGTPVYTLFLGQQIGPYHRARTVRAAAHQPAPDLPKTPTSYAAESAAVSDLLGGFEAENLFLRHQLNIALRCAPPRLRLLDDADLAGSARHGPGGSA